MKAPEERRDFVAGLKQTRKAVLKGTAALVLIADDADPAMTEPLVALCRDRQVPIHWIRSMQELGRLLQISVGAAAAAKQTD